MFGAIDESIVAPQPSKNIKPIIYRFIQTKLRPTSPKCLETKNPTNVGFDKYGFNQLHLILFHKLIVDAV